MTFLLIALILVSPAQATAQSGDADPRELLRQAEILYNGMGETADHAKAAALVKQAAAAGDPLANLRLATMKFYWRLHYEYDRETSAEIAREHYPKALELAQAGDADAQELVGEVLVSGIGRPQDGAEGVRWLERAAASGHVDAMHTLGWVLVSGTGVAADPEKGREWLEKAEKGGDCGASFDLGDRLNSGDGLPRDLERSRQSFERTVLCRYPTGMSRYGWLLLSGEAGSTDVERGIELLTTASALGVRTASYSLGYAYRQGVGVDQDYSQALRWYKEAAALDHRDALNALGWMAENGQGQPKSPELAARFYVDAIALGNLTASSNFRNLWRQERGSQEIEKQHMRLRRIADEGSVHAQRMLANSYFDGFMWVDDKNQLGVKYGRMAAEAGDPWGMWVLGRAYDEGKGIPQDTKRAVEWLSKGADLGNAGCQMRLGYLAMVGKGLPKDLAVGLDWMRKAARQEWLPAVTYLAETLEEGRFGVERDSEEALEWYRIAARLGDREAIGRVRMAELEGR